MTIKKCFKAPEFYYHLSEVKDYLYVTLLSCREFLLLSGTHNHKFQKVIPKKYLHEVRKYTEKLFQKQPSRGVLQKGILKICSKIYRTPMHGCSPVNLLDILRSLFPKNTSKWMFLHFGVILVAFP